MPQRLEISFQKKEDISTLLCCEMFLIATSVCLGEGALIKIGHRRRKGLMIDAEKRN